MSWRDRDWAKFRKDEFDAIYGRTADGSYATATQRGATPRDIGRRRKRRRGSGALRVLRLLTLAVVGTAVLLGGAIATGRVKDIDSLRTNTPTPTLLPVVPQLPAPVHIAWPVPHRTTRIAGTRLLQYGSTLTLSDSHTPMAGNIVVSGRWDSGRWETFAVARGERRTFSFHIPLERRGVLRLRITYPDGGRAVGTYNVR